MSSTSVYLYCTKISKYMYIIKYVYRLYIVEMHVDIIENISLGATLTHIFDWFNLKTSALCFSL